MHPSARQLFGDKDYGDRNWYLMHDNDRKHKAAANVDYLNHKGVKVLDWPSYSPDLNPIENLWATLDRIAKNRHPDNDYELFDSLLESWNAIEESDIHQLICSMPKRCRDVINGNGAPLKY